MAREWNLHRPFNPASDNIPEARDEVEFSIHTLIHYQFTEMHKPQTVAVVWLRPGLEEDQSSMGINPIRRQITQPRLAGGQGKKPLVLAM